MARPGHIIWDWNGTLLDDGLATLESMTGAFVSAGFRDVSIDDHRNHFTRPLSVFLEKLARRTVTADEERALMGEFQRRYDDRLDSVGLFADVRDTLNYWGGRGGTQSILSMCPHRTLVEQVTAQGIADLFVRLDGRTDGGADTKASYLARHLSALDGDQRDNVVLVGDTVDDVTAATETGIACVVHYCGENALQVRHHFDEHDIPVVSSIGEAVRAAEKFLSTPRG